MDNIEAQVVYCPTCDADFDLAYVPGEDEVAAVCDCDVVTHVDEIAEQFCDSDVDASVRGFQ